MTKIAYVSGIQAVAKENPDYLLRGEVAVKDLDLGTIDYLQMTEGEMRLQLLKQQAKMYAASFPSLKVNYGGSMVNPYVQAQRLIEDAIYNGLHLNFDSTGFEKLSDVTGSMFDGLRIAAREAARMANPSSDTMMYSDRRSAMSGTDPIKQIGEIITLDTCQSYERYDYGVLPEGEGMDMYSPELQRYAQFKDIGFDADCLKRMEYRDQFNKFLPDHSSQLLYHFVTDSFLRGGTEGALDSISLANIVNKKAWHSGGVEMFSNISTLSQPILTEWIRTGIMQANQKQGIAPLTPEEVLIQYRDIPESWNYSILGDASKDYRIGIIPILIQIAILIIATSIAAAGLIQVLRGQEPTAYSYANDLFQKVLSPAGTDWKVQLPGGGLPTGGGVTCPTGYKKNASGICVPITASGSTSTAFSKKNLIIGGAVLAAGAGLYLATSDNKKA